MNSGEYKILFNPSAGKGKAYKKKEQIESLLQQFKVPYEMFITKSEKHLRELANKFSQQGKMLVGAGGDSTFSIIINEIKKNHTNVNFGMIAVGSSNDIVKEFGIQSVEKACSALKLKKIKQIDLGAIYSGGSAIHYFLGNACVGLGVFVNKYVEYLIKQRPSIGKMQFLAGILGTRNAFKQNQVPLDLGVETSGVRIGGRVLLAVFSNIKYFASGKKLQPDAKPDDGLMDCCIIEECSFLRLARFMRRISRGKRLNPREVRYLRSDTYEVTSDSEFEIQADGEIIGGLDHPALFKRIEFRIIPQGLDIISP